MEKQGLGATEGEGITYEIDGCDEDVTYEVVDSFFSGCISDEDVEESEKVKQVHTRKQWLFDGI